jgi:hypothetical protein
MVLMELVVGKGLEQRSRDQGHHRLELMDFHQQNYLRSRYLMLPRSVAPVGER